MKTLQEPIAKRANAEDGVKGRFFEGRFKSQILLSQNAILAAMAYVDLNPVRAKIVGSLGKSKNTGIKLRMKKISKNRTFAHEPLAPIAGLATFQLPKFSGAEYIEFVDETGRIMHPGKRGMIGAHRIAQVGAGYEPLDDASQRHRFRLLACGWHGGGINRKSRRDRSKLALRHWFCEIFKRLKRQIRIIFGASASGGVGKNKMSSGLGQAILFDC